MDQTTEIIFQSEPDLTPEEFIDVLRRSTLAERRPVDEPDTICAMLDNANVIVTARYQALLIGVSRAITDYGFCTYLADLAVDVEFQRQGIVKELIQQTHVTAGLGTTLVLLAAPKAADYYQHIGMTRHDSCWLTPRLTAGEMDGLDQ